MERWEGKVAVVTGASAGIGATIVEVLAKAGLKVVALARRLQNLEELAAKLSNSKGKVYPKVCDVNKEEDIVESLEWVESTLGGIDILINSAGYAKGVRLIDDDPASIRQLLNVNVLAVTLTVKIAIASMKRRDVPGSIININSVVGHVNFSGKVPNSLYIPSKWTVTALTESFRQELAHEPNNKIRITSLSPGAVRSEFHKTMTGGELGNDTPSVNPIDVANAVLYILENPQNVLVSELTIRHVNEDF